MLEGLVNCLHGYFPDMHQNNIAALMILWAGIVVVISIHFRAVLLFSESGQLGTQQARLRLVDVALPQINLIGIQEGNNHG